ncbi:ABC transporter ATP-binding protein, partial [bacterium]|nr:ABC transporter ATP-binding protein [bacterium]
MSEQNNTANSDPRKESGQDEYLRIDNLSVDFINGERHTKAVNGISLRLAAGKTLALVGESGSGKSVSALSILKLLPTSAKISGDVYLHGQHLSALTEDELRQVRGRDVGVIFQEPMTSLNPLHRVERQIGEVIAQHEYSKKRLGPSEKASIRERTLDLLKQVGIREPEQKIRAYPHELSGGQRQRVLIAMALANKPKLLIADEPTTALDVTIQQQILQLLKSLQDELGMSILLIT